MNIKRVWKIWCYGGVSFGLAVFCIIKKKKKKKKQSLADEKALTITPYSAYLLISLRLVPYFGVENMVGVYKFND